MKAQNILQTIGNTPHIRINRLFGNAKQQVWIKSERANPGGSIKDQRQYRHRAGHGRRHPRLQDDPADAGKPE